MDEPQDFPGQWLAVHKGEVLAHNVEPLLVAAEVKKFREQGLAGIHVYRMRAEGEPEFEGGLWA